MTIQDLPSYVSNSFNNSPLILWSPILVEGAPQFNCFHLEFLKFLFNIFSLQTKPGELNLNVKKWIRKFSQTDENSFEFMGTFDFVRDKRITFRILVRLRPAPFWNVKRVPRHGVRFSCSSQNEKLIAVTLCSLICGKSSLIAHGSFFRLPTDHATVDSCSQHRVQCLLTSFRNIQCSPTLEEKPI